jgi:hypothetical protein
MACEGKKYHGLNEVMMRGIRLDLHQMGIPITEASEGVVMNQSYGVEVEYSYSDSEQSLFVRILQKPFFIPCSMIYGRLDQAIERRQMGHDPMADH